MMFGVTKKGSGTLTAIPKTKNNGRGYRPEYWDKVPHSTFSGDAEAKVHTIVLGKNDLDAELARIGFQTERAIDPTELMYFIEKGYGLNEIVNITQISRKRIISKAKEIKKETDLYRNTYK